MDTFEKNWTRERGLKKTPTRYFASLTSFVMHKTKAEKGFKDGVLDTSALLIG